MKKKPARQKILSSGAVLSDKRLDNYRSDGWTNVLTGLGLGNDKKALGQMVFNRLVEVDVETLYSGDDICARIIDLLPDSAMRKGVDFEGLNEEEELALQIKLSEIEAKKKITQALKWGRLYGGAGLLIGTDEMADLTEPLQPEEIKNVLSLTLITRYELYPSQLQYDPLKKNFGYPEFYRLQLRGSSEINGHEVHHSRIVRFNGAPLPRRLHIQNQYWDDSILSKMYEVIRSFGTTHSSVATVMQDFRVGIFKMKNLAEMISMGEDGLIQKRIALVDAAKSVARSVIIDADSEEFEQATGQLSGVKDLIDAVNERLVIATGIPITVLFGRSPQGLGGSGRHEETNWYDMVASYQEDEVLPIYKRICEVILESKEGPTHGNLPQGFGISFNPLWQMDEKEQAEMRYTQAQADAIYMTNGSVTPEEIAISRFGGEDWDPQTKIDLQLRRAVDTQTQQIVEGKGGGADNQTAAPAAPGSGDLPNLPNGLLDSPKHIPPVELQETGQVSEKSGAISRITAREPYNDANDIASQSYNPRKQSSGPTSKKGSEPLPRTSPRSYSPSGDLENLNNDDKSRSTVGAVDPLTAEDEPRANVDPNTVVKAQVVTGQMNPAHSIIVSKQVAKNRSQARAMAQEHAGGLEIQSMDETSQSYQFQIRSPGDFVPGSMKTMKPEGKKGVAVVYGKLKGK